MKNINLSDMAMFDALLGTLAIKRKYYPRASTHRYVTYIFIYINCTTSMNQTLTSKEACPCTVREICTFA